MRSPVDDRGRPAVLRMLDHASRLSADQLIRVNRAGVKPLGLGEARLAYAIGLVVGVVIVIQPISWLVKLPMIVALLLVWFVGYPRVQARGRFVERCGLARTAQRCAACWYDLAGLEPADDGCRLCPECGAAWRVPKNDSK